MLYSTSFIDKNLVEWQIENLLTIQNFDKGKL